LFGFILGGLLTAVVGGVGGRYQLPSHMLSDTAAAWTLQQMAFRRRHPRRSQVRYLSGNS
jgi:hypothetical protein